MIFLSITGSWTAALLYDRRQKRNVQRKWCELVSHIAQEPLPTNTLPRRVTVFLSAPPGDGLRSAREHFTEYVKPVLVAAALDWDVVEGRKEGDVRAGLAERIRRLRRKMGDVAETPLEEDVPLALERVRAKIGVEEAAGIKGDIVIGRHTWKEYVRGLHEGWLGPMDAPKPPPPAIAPLALGDEDVPAQAEPATAIATATTSQDASAVVDEFLGEKPADQKTLAPATTTTPEKPAVVPAYNTPATYAESSLSSSVPPEFTPSAPIAFPHILGFLNTPIRMYYFLNRRSLAEDVGRQTAAVVLAAHRAYEHSADDTLTSEDGQSGSTASAWEQQRVLADEEANWTKASRKRVDGEGERVRLDDVAVDARIAGRMRRFELDGAAAQKAGDIERGLPGVFTDLWAALMALRM